MNGKLEDENTIEGLEEKIQVNGWGDEYPLDSVFVRRQEWTANETVTKIKKKRFHLNPDFQRDFVWNVEKQSKLIESCLMRIPLPVFYVAEAKDGSIIIVDGLQRLTTLQRYIDKEFPLKFSLLPDGRPHPLEGKEFSDLSVTFQERIEETPLIFYILDAKAPERAKLDIFDRVNSGVALSRQQMRNCLYNGPATLWLKDAVTNKKFITATNSAFDAKAMRDREAVNRFCAFRLLGYKEYKNADMDGFMGQALEHMNKLPADELSKLMNEFEYSMETNAILFGVHAFRKSLANGDDNHTRSPINISLFEVCSVVLAGLPKNLKKKYYDNVRDSIRCIINENYVFRNSISFSTSGTKTVHNRFRIAYEVLEGKI